MYSDIFEELNNLNEIYLTESSELYCGIFWIVDLDNIDNNKKYCFQIPCFSDGTINNYNGLDLNAKTGTTYNHEKLWKTLPTSLTHNKAFDYYPRGRVQINNNKAVVFLNPNINTEDVQSFIIHEFNLNQHNGIIKIVFNSDGSNHYKCYLDR